MNLKNKIVKIVRSKTFGIICIIVILIVVYMVVGINVPKVDNKVEKWNEEAIVDNQKDEEKYQKENTEMTGEIVDEIEEAEVQDSTDSDIEKVESKSENSKNEKIYVYVTGEVNNPGVFVLPYGSRISDAIDYAGGVTQNADIMKVNLVYMLQDGMKVNIPSSK